MQKQIITLPTNNSSRGEKRERSSTENHVILTGHRHHSPKRKRQRQEDYITAKPDIFVLSHSKLLVKQIFEFLGDQEWLFVAVVCTMWCSVYREYFRVAQTGLLKTLHSLSRLKYANEQIGFDPLLGLVKNDYGVPWSLEYWAGYQSNLKVIRHVKDICDSDGSDACRGAAQAGRKPLLRQLRRDGNYAFKQDIIYYAAMAKSKSVLVWLYKKILGIWNDLSMSVCLMTAAMYGRIKNAKWLIKMGAPWHRHSGYWARKRGQKRFLKWALGNGCTIQPLSYSHCRPTVITAVSSSCLQDEQHHIQVDAPTNVSESILVAARSIVRKSLGKSPSKLSHVEADGTVEEGEIVL